MYQIVEGRQLIPQAQLDVVPIEPVSVLRLQSLPHLLRPNARACRVSDINTGSKPALEGGREDMSSRCECLVPQQSCALKRANMNIYIVKAAAECNTARSQEACGTLDAPQECAAAERRPGSAASTRSPPASCTTAGTCPGRKEAYKYSHKPNRGDPTVDGMSFPGLVTLFAQMT